MQRSADGRSGLLLAAAIGMGPHIPPETRNPEGAERGSVGNGHDVESCLPSIPLGDFVVGGDERDTQDKGGGHDEPLGGIAVECFQSGQFRIAT